MLFFRQVLVLVHKNLLIAFVRRPITTTLRALALPCFIAWFFAYAQSFFAPPARYGVGTPRDVRSLEDALALTGSRHKLVFVNSGFQGGQIEQIITEVGDIARRAGKTVINVESDQDLMVVCRNSLRGASGCIAGISFHSSPTEPAGQNLPYNYTLHYDGILGSSIFVNHDNNDQQVLVLPLQKAIDRAIANANGTVPVNAVDVLQEFPYTMFSQEFHELEVRDRYMNAIDSFLGAAFFIGMCGVQYQQVGAQATEREGKIAQLLEVMMPNQQRWQPQVARLFSYHIAFTTLYLPGWLIMGIILKATVFKLTSYGIVIGLHLLTGLSLSSFSLLAGAFFKRAQLSGITTILISLVLAIIAQVTPMPAEAKYVLGALFPSTDYVFSIRNMAQFEWNRETTSLIRYPYYDYRQPLGIWLYIILAIQIVVFPLLAIVVERCLWGTASGKRHLHKDPSQPAVKLDGFTKHFRPNWFKRAMGGLVPKKKKETVRAAEDLNFTVSHGQIVVLLGANGSGKSTTLDAIAGLSKPTKGSITLNFDHGIGYCPQKNVLWGDLTVYEHIKVFEGLKSTAGRATEQDMLSLIKDCDLDAKVHAKARSLSGGQMRKLQLAMMFIGNSGICLVDECSSGIDPLARKKIQDIMLTERSRSQRTIIFTSHYLDEADIADYILIMSKGKLKVHGTAPEIKQSGQYRVHVYNNSGKLHLPSFSHLPRQEMFDQTIYTIENAALTSKLLTEIESQGYTDYSVSGPTVEDTFMAVAEEMVPSFAKDTTPLSTPEGASLKDKSVIQTVSFTGGMESDQTVSKDLDIATGTHVGPFWQATALFWKRFRVFFRAVYPNLAALLIVPIAAGLTSRFLQGFQRAGCVPQTEYEATDYSLSSALAYSSSGLLLGPRDAWNSTAVDLILQTIPENIRAYANASASTFFDGIAFVESSAELYQFMTLNYSSIYTGAIFLGTADEPPLIAYVASYGGYVADAALVQNVVSTIRYRNPIIVSFSNFDIPWQAGQGRTLQYTIYFELVLSIVPAFFALYPTMERLRRVRALHYSNGVRALPLWLSYLAFDMMFVVVAATASVAILAARFGPIMFGLGQFWLVMVLFGLCATLCSYVVSLFARSQLASFAIAAAYQALGAILWLIAYLSLVTYGDPNYIDRNLNYAHFTMSLILPSGSLFKALFVSLNVLSINCRGSRDYIGSPGDITAYGGPILYLIIQSAILFALLVWWDSGNKFGAFMRSRHRAHDQEEKKTPEPEVIDELKRVTESTDDGLRVLHLTKAYDKNLAVDDASFGVKRGEVFGLLGPNGAGKSTTISVVRGDIKANEGEIFIENLSLTHKRALARQHLSVCPQYDAMDRLTVTEHLRFYARIRGVKEVERNVQEVIRAVGLDRFRHRMGEKLSGGNKRKLSLGIALMGNPGVMLLDEPSSGMDVAAKRVMWRTLEAVVGGRSIVLTTHSMEEADRLCDRAAILARRLLTVDTVTGLKRRHGDAYYVHVLLASAPHTDPAEHARIARWVETTFAGAAVDPRSHHGQLRFSVPIHHNLVIPPVDEKQPTVAVSVTPAPADQATTRIASLFAQLEQHKDAQGIAHYSVGHATLDQVFLRIVTKHDVEEENSSRRQRDDRHRPQQGWLRRRLKF